MSSDLLHFEKIVRRLQKTGANTSTAAVLNHPFDERNIHQDIDSVSRKLFDDGHYSQATFEALKFLEKRVRILANSQESGQKLMMEAFDEKKPKIWLTPIASVSERDEQNGYRFMLAGAMAAIRNPRGHDINIDSIDVCLDHLSLASVLLRRIDDRIRP